MKTFATIALALVLLLSSRASGVDPDQIKWSNLKVRTLDDQLVELAAPERKATVLVFVTNVCPIANAYQPRLRELQQSFADRGIQFVQVYPVQGMTEEAASEHRRQFDIRSAAVLDPQRQLAHALGAKVTPEAIILDPQGKVLYRGRIDNQYAALGKKRPEPTAHDLADALQAIVTGQPIAAPAAPAVGCLIR